MRTLETQDERVTPLVSLHIDAEVLNGPEGFLLLDHHTGMCLLLGGEERYLLHLLQNSASMSAVCDSFKSRFGKLISSQQIDEFVEQMSMHGMLVGDAEENIPRELVASDPPPEVEDPFSLSSRGAKLNFVFDLLVLFFGWILHPVWIVPIVGLMWMAANILREQGDVLLLEHLNVLGHYHILFYLIFILVPKHFLLSCVEATLTGMVCRRFRGRIRAAKIRLRLGLLPAFQAEYDDTILMLPLRGRRTFMTIGIWSVLAIGSLALIGTSLTDSESELHKIFLLLILPCLIRLVIVCNIFFRYSSLYLLLVDVFDERNLMADAITEASRWLTFRLPARPMSYQRRFWLVLYGIGYFAYRFILSIVILWAGWYLSVHGLGLVTALTTIAAFVYFNNDLFSMNGKSAVRKSLPQSQPSPSTVA